MLLYLIKLLFYALIYHGTLLIFLLMLEFKLKKEKSSTSLTTYKNLKNKHRIDLINAKAMFTHDKFISMQQIASQFSNQIAYLVKDKNRHTLNLLMTIYLIN